MLGEIVRVVSLIKDKNGFDDLILSQEIDPTLHRFVEYCETEQFSAFCFK